MRSINKTLQSLLAAVLLSCAPLASLALESDVDKPIEVEADSVQIDEGNEKGNSKSIYKGNVVLVQGSIRLTADKVTVIQYTNKSDQIQAVGNPVRITQKSQNGKKPIKGHSSRMEYYVDSDMLYLIGNAVLTQDKDTFKSDRIAYDRKQSLIKGGTSAKGKHRVRVTIKSKKKSENQ